jgi:CRISPR-associated endonuclease/helicase Cas3
MEFKYLLAKSCPDPDNPPEQATLLGHTKAVVEAFINLFGTANFPTRLAKRWLEFFRLDIKYYPIFFTNTLIACILHDSGKANSGFQRMIRKKGDQEIKIASSCKLPPETRGLYACLHDHTQKAELGFEKGCKGTPDKRF